MLTALIYISGGLLAIILMLLAAIIVRRVRYDRYRRRYQARTRIWEPLFFSYLEGEDTGGRIAATLRTEEDYLSFVEFITFYLKNLSGEEAQAIADLAFRTGVSRRLYADLKSRRSKRRAVAATTLGLLNDRNVLPYLKRMLEDRDPYLVYAGAYGIACLREYSLFMPVMRTLLSRTPITYEGASELLVRFGEGICPTLADILREALARHERVSEREGEILGGEGPAKENGLKESPGGEPGSGFKVDLGDFVEVSMLVDILGYFRYADAGELLLQVMEKSGDEEITIHVLKAVVRLRTPQAAHRIAPLLDHPNWVIRSQAIRALGVLGEKMYRPDIQARLQDRQWWVRHYAAQALEALA
jgi:HEAT repeat protein